MASKRSKKKKRQFEEFEEEFGSNETFAFIAGYLDSGIPYGITWEEMAEIEKQDQINRNELRDDDLPF